MLQALQHGVDAHQHTGAPFAGHADTPPERVQRRRGDQHAVGTACFGFDQHLARAGRGYRPLLQHERLAKSGDNGGLQLLQRRPKHLPRNALKNCGAVGGRVLQRSVG